MFRYLFFVIFWDSSLFQKALPKITNKRSQNFSVALAVYKHHCQMKIILIYSKMSILKSSYSEIHFNFWNDFFKSDLINDYSDFIEIFYQNQTFFSETNDFTFSFVFSESKKFQPTNIFSESIDFTKSQRFSKSENLDQTNNFSSSATFSNSIAFTETGDFIRILLGINKI